VSASGLNLVLPAVVDGRLRHDGRRAGAGLRVIRQQPTCHFRSVQGTDLVQVLPGIERKLAGRLLRQSWVACSGLGRDPRSVIGPTAELLGTADRAHGHDANA